MNTAVRVRAPDGFSGLKAEANRAVLPQGIFSFDKCNFPIASPRLELLFATDRRFHRFRHLEMDKACDSVSAGKSPDCFCPMLPQATDEIGSHADVQGSVPAVGKDVDARLPFHLDGNAVFMDPESSSG